MSKSKILSWPSLGLRESHAHSQAPPARSTNESGRVVRDFTTNHGTELTLNCRTFEPATDRSRGAQRSGISRLTTDPLAVGVIQELAQVLGLGGITVLPIQPGALEGGGSIPEEGSFVDAMTAINSVDTTSGSPYSDAYANGLWTPTMSIRDADPIVLDGGAPGSFNIEGSFEAVANGVNHDLTTGDIRQLLRVDMPASVTNGPVAFAAFTGQIDWFYEVLGGSGLKVKPVLRFVFSTDATNWTTIGEFRVPGGTVSGSRSLAFEGWAGPDWPTQTYENLAFSIPLPFAPSLGSSFDVGVLLDLAYDAAAVGLLPNSGPAVGDDRTISFIATLHDFNLRLFSG